MSFIRFFIGFFTIFIKTIFNLFLRFIFGMKKMFVFKCLFSLLFLFSCVHEPLPLMGPFEIIDTGNNYHDTVWKSPVFFRLFDQNNNCITQSNLEGKVVLADFFFTSCPTICPNMKRQMLGVHQVFKNNDNVLLLSFSIDPKHDSVEVLNAYAKKLGINNQQWLFLTGNQDTIYQLAKENFLSFVSEDSGAPGGYLHSGAFILLDTSKRIRGVYDGTQSETIKKIVKDIKKLLSE